MINKRESECWERQDQVVVCGDESQSFSKQCLMVSDGVVDDDALHFNVRHLSHLRVADLIVLSGL